jgi:archaellum biogenesis ATPase FlaH
MQKFVSLFHESLDANGSFSDLNRVPEFVKAHPEGAFRSIFFADESKKGFYGPLVLVFSVRKARDILLEGCEYADLEVAVESGGRRLPQLPALPELERLLDSDSTIVYVNGHQYKPLNEVFGFQQVYDDAVKCIDVLKKMGIAQETMAIYATPDEIAIEVHHGPLGLEGGDDMPDLYYRLLCRVADIREAGGRPQKGSVRTVVLQSCSRDYRLLLPGSNHPGLHRPRVNVGASHFAYGVAAFSDYCGKKRTLQECLQETFNWVKFVQAELPPVPGLGDKIRALPLPAIPGKKASGTAVSVAARKAGNASFQPFKAELESAGLVAASMPPAVSSFSSGLDRSLGGGWGAGGLHLIVGPRESGKGSMLLQQAFLSEAKLPVLYVSFEHGMRELVLRSVCQGSGLNYSDIAGQLSQTAESGEHARASVKAAISQLVSRIGNNLHLTGYETSHFWESLDEVKQLISMIPGDNRKLIVLESLDLQHLLDNSGLMLRQLREIASCGNTVIAGVHAEILLGKRPHFIEENDLALLGRLEKHSDSILTLNTEKANLRRFVAMVKGQIDASVVGSLEQKALQLAGGRRLRSDTYSLARLIHTRTGRRDQLLFLYQPDFFKMYELATMPLQRP